MHRGIKGSNQKRQMNSIITSNIDSEENHAHSMLSQSSTFDAGRFFCDGFSAGARVHPAFGSNNDAGGSTTRLSYNSSTGFPYLNSLPFNLGDGLGGIINKLNVRHNQRRGQNLDVPGTSGSSNSDAAMMVAETESLGGVMAHGSRSEADPASHHSLMTHSERIVKANIAEEQDAVAEALNSLSRHEREHAFQDIHGVADIPYEDDQIIQHRLTEMKQYLLERVSKNEHKFNLYRHQTGSVSAEKSNAYIIQQAVSTMLQQQQRVSNNSVSSISANDTMASQDFLLLFLRAEDYDVDAASARLLRFMEEKLELFGAERLLKDITLDDMTETDMHVLKCGMIQRVREKDRAGRDIVIVLPSLYSKDVNHKSMVRAFYYVLMSPIMSSLKYGTFAAGKAAAAIVGQQQRQQQRHESHLRGLVQIVHRLPKHIPLDRAAMYKTQKLRHALPYRYAAVHMFTEDPTVPMLLGLFKKFINIRTLSRMQMHCGKFGGWKGRISSF